MYFQKEALEILDQLKAQLQSSSRPCLITLGGDLGVGKTTFLKTLFSLLGLESDRVQSPTFLKVLEYQIPNLGKALHWDCYRVEDAEDLEKTGFGHYQNVALWVVEWPEKFLEFLKANPDLGQFLGFKNRIAIEISMDHNGNRSLKWKFEII